MKLKGWVGSREDRTIVGWVVDRDDLLSPLVIQVQLNEWKSDLIPADQYRPHLSEKNIGSGRYGYSLRVPESVRVTPGASIIVLVSDGSKNPLGKLPYSAEIVDKFFTSSRDRDIETHNKKTLAHAMLKVVSDGALPERRAITSLSELLVFGEAILKQPKLAELLRDAGRALLSAKKIDDGNKLLTASSILNPADNETIFQRGLASGRLGKHDDALSFFRTLFPGTWRQARVLSEYAQALRRAIEASGHNPSPALVDELKTIVEARVSLEGAKETVLPPVIARTLSRFGFFDLALQAMDQTLIYRPDLKDAYIAKARTLIESGRTEEGLETAKKVLEQWPDDEGAHHMIRVFRDMRKATNRGMKIVRLDLSHSTPTLFDERNSPLAAPKNINDLCSALDNFEVDWLNISTLDLESSMTKLRTIAHAQSAAGFLHPDPDTFLWKATAIRDLAESNLISLESITSDLGYYKPFYARPAPNRKLGTAVLISRYGPNKFGGGEHFLHSAAIHYKNMGYSPLILGLQENFVEGLSGSDADGLRYAFVDPDPVTLRKFLIEEGTTYIHAISGTGFLIAEALGDMNIPFVYGVHYFREVLGGANSEIYFDQSGEPIPRTDFSYLLARASTVYANSSFTQKFLESAHGVRCPIVFSVPEDQ